MSVTAKEKFQALCDKLYERTVEKQIQWEPDLLDGQALSCTIGKNTVELSEGRTADQSPIVIVTIRDVNGQTVDTFNDEDLRGVSVTYGRFESYWQLLKEILAVARRQSSGADQVLDELLSDLDDFW